MGFADAFQAYVLDFRRTLAATHFLERRQAKRVEPPHRYF
jgi:hypothetical protein